MNVPATILFSNNNSIATIVPQQLLFAGSTYYLYITTGVKDVAGNPLPNQMNSSFTTELAPGTSNLPDAATITINPLSLFANGQIATTVTVTNINRSGTPVPNGTLIGVTADPAFVLTSVGGVISGNSAGTSSDPRFLLFSTEGASVTVYYTPPDLDWLMPGATTGGIIQMASLDLDNKPVSLIAKGTATLFRIKTVAMTAVPTSLPADGISQSNLEATVRDNLGNLVPDGTMVGITVAPIFTNTTASGAIIGGTASNKDGRVRIFTTTGGRFTFSYQSPNSRGPGYEVIQAMTTDKDGYPTGLISTLNINLTN